MDPEEDNLLCELVSGLGTKHWELISARIVSRNPIHCLHLDRNFKAWIGKRV